MKKEKQVKSYKRRTKSGKVVTVKAHTAKYDAAEALKEATKKDGAGKELSSLKKKSAKDDPVIAYAKENGYVVRRDGTFGYKGDGSSIRWTTTREVLEKAMKKKPRKSSISSAIERDFGVKGKGFTTAEKKRYAKENGFTRGGMRDGRRIYKKNGKDYVWNFSGTKLIKI